MGAAPRYPVDFNRQPPHSPHSRWKKVVGWMLGYLAILLVVLIATLVVLLHSRRFPSYLLAKAEQKFSDTLNTTVQARDFHLTLSLSSPALELDGVVVNGAQPYPNPPLLQVDRIYLQVRITSLLQRTWYLNSAVVDHPVVHVFVDGQGRNNLPQMQSKGSGTHTNIFDLGVTHAKLNGGQVYYNDEKSDLNADLQYLTLRSGFDRPRKQFSGVLSYRDGHLQYGKYQPMIHNLDADFSANPSQFTLHDAVLSSGPSTIAIRATLRNYSQPQVQATYDASIDLGQFRRILQNSQLPVGVIRMTGSLDYGSKPNQPMMSLIALKGDISSRALRIDAPQFKEDVRDITAHYSLADGDLDVSDFRSDLLGGEMAATLQMRDITGASRSKMRMMLRGVSIADASHLLASPALKQVALGGTLNADAEANWGKTLKSLVATTDADVNATVAPVNATGNPEAAMTPGSANSTAQSQNLKGFIHARYSAPQKQLTLTNSSLHSGQTTIDLNGTISERSALQVRFQSNDLHELETTAALFSTPKQGSAPQPLELYGSATFVGSIQGSTTAPQITGQLLATNLRVKGTSWRLLRTGVMLSPAQASFQNGILQPVGRGRVMFNLAVGLENWSFTSASPLKVTLSASQMNAEDLSRLAGLQTPVSGTLSTNVAVHGTELNPIGQGTLTLTKAVVSQQPIQSATIHFQGTESELHANLAVDVPAVGAAHGTLIYFPKQKSYNAQLQANGIHIGQLQAVKAKEPYVTGVANLDASGSGTIENPGLQARIAIPQLKVRNQVINQTTLQAIVENHVANVSLDSAMMGTALHGQATVSLTGAYQADATLNTQVISLQPLIAAYAPSQAGNITGQTELHASLHGPLKDKNRLEVHLTIPSLQVNYQNTVQLAAAGPIHADFINGLLQIQRVAIRGTDTDIQLQGNIPVSSTAPASLLLLGTVNLKIIELFDSDVTTSGELQFNINSFGQTTNPNVQGVVRIVNAAFASGSAPLGLDAGNGVLTLTKDRLDVTSFEGTMGGGRVTAKGAIAYRPAVRFDLALAGAGIRMLYPQGVRQTLGANLTLTGSMQRSDLRGRVQFQQISLTPDFDFTTFVNQFGETIAVPPPTGGFEDNLNLDVALQSSGELRMASRQLSLQSMANLRLTGTASQPVILGRMELNSGDLIFNGNRYVLQGGTIDFVNPTQTEAVLNVAVNTTVQQYNVHLRFEGPVDQIRTEYSSDPSLPTSDIINLLAFGQTTESAAANSLSTPSPFSNAGAEQVIASQVSGQVTNRVSKIVGISQLSIDPVLAGSTAQNPGALISVQQRVTSSLFVNYTTDVTATQQQTIQVQYQMSPRVAVETTRDQNGGFGFGVRIRKEW